MGRSETPKLPLGVVFGDGVAEDFAELPHYWKEMIGRSITLLSFHPAMYPVRRRGVMRGYRYIPTSRYLVFYEAADHEVRIMAIVPGQMRRA